MPRKSSITQLPNEAQSKLQALYEAGATLDDIHDAVSTFLEGLNGEWHAPSRSAIHRHRSSYEATARKMREAREMATAIATEIGEIPEDKTGQLLIDMLRTLIFKALQRNVEGENTVDPKEFMFFGRALKDVASASSISTRQAQDIRKAAREEAADAVGKEAKKRGFDAVTIREFFDIAAGRKG